MAAANDNPIRLGNISVIKEHAFDQWRFNFLENIWRDFAYEYEHDKLAIDVINGGPLLREWVDDASAASEDLDAMALLDEQAWLSEREGWLRY